MKPRAFDPRALDVVAFCRSDGTLAGQWPLGLLSRLGEMLFVPADGPVADAAASVDWQVRGELRSQRGGGAEPWLHLGAHARVSLQCQRCLGAMVADLAVQRAFRFVSDEDEAARQDEDAEEDVLALGRRLDLSELVEDELILALPIVPRHADCPLPRPPGSQDDAAADDRGTQRPFDVLARLKSSR